MQKAAIAEVPGIDSVWTSLRRDALEASRQEPVLAGLLHATILNHDCITTALAYRLAQTLADPDLNPLMLHEVCGEAFASDPGIRRAVERDMEAVRERDPACRNYLQPFLYYKGFAALQAHRVGHWLWNQGRQTLALHLQSRVSTAFQVDTHPAARIGAGVFIDHATGIVIGETATIDDDVSMLHAVTLGGNGRERGDRHPKIGRGVLLSVGAKVLGNIHVGDGARVAAGSVVLHDVPPHATVAGVPAKIVRCATCDEPARNMDHGFGSGI